jgi:hypothetical protein
MKVNASTFAAVADKKPCNLIDRSTLREDLQAVGNLLGLWAHYPYLVAQAFDDEGFKPKEIVALAKTINDAKDQIIVAAIQKVIGGPA